MIGEVTTGKRDENLLTGHTVEEEIGEREAEDQLGWQRDGDEDQRVPDRGPEPRIPDEPLVVHQTMERGVLSHHREVLHADEQRVDDRKERD
jgi:hypothetical protein